MFKIAEKSNTLEILFKAAMLIAVLSGGAANAGAAEGDDTATRERGYSDEIKVCQVGYLIGETKLAILTAEPEG